MPLSWYLCVVGLCSLDHFPSCLLCEEKEIQMIIIKVRDLGGGFGVEVWTLAIPDNSPGINPSSGRRVSLTGGTLGVG